MNKLIFLILFKTISLHAFYTSDATSAITIEQLASYECVENCRDYPEFSVELNSGYSEKLKVVWAKRYYTSDATHPDDFNININEDESVNLFYSDTYDPDCEVTLDVSSVDGVIINNEVKNCGQSIAIIWEADENLTIEDTFGNSYFFTYAKTIYSRSVFLDINTTSDLINFTYNIRVKNIAVTPKDVVIKDKIMYLALEGEFGAYLIKFELIDLENHKIKTIKKGWNLTSLPTSNFIEYPEALVIWNFDTNSGKWLIYPYDFSEYEKLSTTTSSNAYWVFAKNDFNISFYSSNDTFDYSSLKDSWHMLGTIDEISDFNQFIKNTRILWTYDDDVWKAKGFDSNTENDINEFGYDNLEKISAFSGFWMNKISNEAPIISIDISPDRPFFFLYEPITFRANIIDTDGNGTNLISWGKLYQYEQQFITSFNTSGTVNVTLDVTDNKDDSTQTNREVTILNMQKPINMSDFSFPKEYQYTIDDLDMSLKLSDADSPYEFVVMKELAVKYSGETYFLTEKFYSEWKELTYLEGKSSIDNLVLFDGNLDEQNVKITLEKYLSSFRFYPENKTLEYKGLGAVKAIVSGTISHFFIHAYRDYSSGRLIFVRGDIPGPIVSNYEEFKANMSSIIYPTPGSGSSFSFYHIIDNDDFPQFIRDELAKDIIYKSFIDEK